MDRREVLWIVLFLVLGGIGLALFLRFYDEAFPVASLDFKLSREEAFQKARGYLEGLGYDTEAYENAQVLDHDQEGQIFLERTLGLEEANRLVRDWVSIWYWSVRWFRPLEKEEFHVNLDPGGRVVHFSHEILESAEGANLTQEDALPVAEQFLRETQEIDLGDYELIERSSEKRKARTDHTFTYRKQGFTVGEDGHYRLEVTVQGDRVGRFGEYLKVPETFARHYREIRSRANLLSQAADVFWLVLAVAMLVVLVQKFRERALVWQAGLVVGGLVLVAAVAGQVNSLPLIRFGYPTTQSYASFILTFLAFGIIGSCFIGGIICLAGTAGGALGREVLFGGRRSPFGRLSPGAIFSGRAVRAIFVGYGIGFAMLGYLTLFYIVGSRYFGVWSPAWMVDYDNAFSTAIPWIYPLLAGLVASTQEEFFFRLLAIPLVIRWFNRRWLAVLLPAVVWGFLHSNYPVEPVYTRGIEVSIVGIAFGLAFLRYGIWAPIIAHYAVNAFMTALPMMKSSSLYFQVSGVVVTGVLLVPGMIALFAVLTGRSREREKEEEVAPEPIGEPPPPEPEPLPRETPVQKGPEAYRTGKREWILAGVFALAGAALLVGLQVEQFGQRTLSLSVTRSEAVRLAEAFRREAGPELEGYRRTAWFQSFLGSSHYAYLVRKAGVARADTLASDEGNPWMWYVRWFKPLEKEELRIGVDSFRRVRKFEHRIPEGQAGAELGVEAAQPLAEAYVEDRFGRTVSDTTQYRLLEAEAEKREARMDHRFVWERIDRKVEDGEFRVEATVQGDRVGHVRHRYKAPEAFLRELHEQRVKDIVPPVVLGVLMLATVVLAGISFFRAFREKQIGWGFPVRIGILAAALALLDRINELPSFFRAYDTSQDLWVFLGRQALGLLTSTGFIGLIVIVIVALAMALFRTRYPGEMDPSRWFGLLREGGGGLWKDALLLGVVLALVGRGTGQLGLFADYHWFTNYLEPGGFSPPALNTYLPFLDRLISAVGGAVIGPFFVLAAFLIWQQVLKRTWTLLAGVGVVVLLLSAVGPAEDLYHFAGLTGLTLISWAALIFLVGWVVRFNLLAYMVALWIGPLIGPGLALLESPEPFYQANGAAMLLFGLAPLVLTLAATLKARRALPPGAGR